jgi:hypothetical protein
MANIISNEEKAALLIDVSDAFDGFCQDIVVYKEPLKTPVVVNPGANLFGFGENQQEVQYTYTPVTGVFPATVRTPLESIKDGDTQPDINAQIYAEDITIKVRGDARAFINNGKTEKITIDDNTYIVLGNESKAHFIATGEYFKFRLRNTA